MSIKIFERNKIGNYSSGSGNGEEKMVLKTKKRDGWT